MQLKLPILLKNTQLKLYRKINIYIYMNNEYIIS